MVPLLRPGNCNPTWKWQNKAEWQPGGEIFLKLVGAKTCTPRGWWPLGSLTQGFVWCRAMGPFRGWERKRAHALPSARKENENVFWKLRNTVKHKAQLVAPNSIPRDANRQQDVLTLPGIWQKAALLPAPQLGADVLQLMLSSASCRDTAQAQEVTACPQHLGLLAAQSRACCSSSHLPAASNTYLRKVPGELIRYRLYSTEDVPKNTFSRLLSCG